MRRWPLFAALAYVVLLFAGLVVVPAAPQVTAPGARLVRYHQDHGNGVRVAMWLSAWSMVPLTLLVARLRSCLAGMSREVPLLGAAGLVMTTIVWSWFNLGLALHPSTLDPHVARTTADVGAFLGPVLTVSIVLFVVPIGLAARRREGGLPRWLAWLTAVFAVEQSIETITVFGKRGFIAPRGPMNSMLALASFSSR